MIEIIFIIFYPVITLLSGFLIGSWKPKEKSAGFTELNYQGKSVVEDQPILPEKKHEQGLVRRPTAEELEKKVNPKLAEVDEAWDDDMEKIFGSPYKLGIQTK